MRNSSVLGRRLTMTDSPAGKTHTRITTEETLNCDTPRLLSNKLRLARQMLVYSIEGAFACEWNLAKFNAVRRRGEVIFMNSRNHVNKSVVEVGKVAAFILLAALTLPLPLQVRSGVSRHR
jgi:hypothetical protein